MHRDWLRASSVAKWSDCPRYARQHVEGSGRSIAAVVGTMTHAILQGKDQVSIPSQIWFDRTTPSLEDARIQSRAMAQAVRFLYRQHEITVEQTEIPIMINPLRIKGHIDAVGRHGATSRVAIDLKTGRGTGAGWLQLGCYATLLAYRDKEVDEVAIVHMPRAKVSNMKTPTIEFRDAMDVRAAFGRWLQWLDTLHEQDLADVSTPGEHCRYCKLDCAVRAQEPIR